MTDDVAPLDWPQLLTGLVAGADLTDGQAEGALAAIMRGEVREPVVAGFLTALAAKGETTDEIVGLASAMRRFATPVPVSGPLVDTCGTGGDRAGTFNISTCAAVVAAAAGARVAKHGNRAASSACGTADLLEAWGVHLDLSPEGVAHCIDATGIGFCFAQSFHPAMRHVMPARRSLGIRTAFNVLGPLTNPAGVEHQTIGVAHAGLAPRMAAALARLGAVRAFVIHGSDGLDELTTTGPSQVWEVVGGEVRSWTFDPADLGIARAAPGDLVGGDVATNRAIADGVLAGEAGPRRDIVELGAAAALLAVGVAATWEEGLATAAAAIESGRAAATRDALVAASQEAAGRS